MVVKQGCTSSSSLHLLLLPATPPPPCSSSLHPLLLPAPPHLATQDVCQGTYGLNLQRWFCKSFYEMETPGKPDAITLQFQR